MPLQGDSSSRDTLGVILSDATYPLREFQRISGLGDSALRAARRKGLVVTRVGRCGFVTGRDFYGYLQALAEGSRNKAVLASDCHVGGADA
jgi:hypothetical protein